MSDTLRDCYLSWELAMKAMREQWVRDGIVEPRNDTERRWQQEGPKPRRELETVRDG